MKYVCLMEIGKIEENIIQHISKEIENVMNFPVKQIKMGVEMVKNAFSIERNQFLASKILRTMFHYTPTDCLKTLGIIDVDIYTPIFTFIFGQSQFEGKVSLISLHRLKQDFYSLPSNNKLLIERAVKESLHELGHNFGLSHCDNPSCVMHFSNNVVKIDRKGKDFCKDCKKYLRIKIAEEGKNGQ